MIRLPSTATPETVGQVVAESFAGGNSHVHIGGLVFNNMGMEAQSAFIQEASEVLGTLTLSNSCPQSVLWRLDSSSSPHAQNVPYHTDNPFYKKPEKFVGFWNIRSSSEGGENLLCSFETVRSGLADTATWGSLFCEAQQEIMFSDDSVTASAPVLDLEKENIRYDRRYLASVHNNLNDRLTAFFELLQPDIAVKLYPGELLFFDNRSLIHARTPYNDPERVNIRVRIEDA